MDCFQALVAKVARFLDRFSGRRHDENIIPRCYHTWNFGDAFLDFMRRHPELALAKMRIFRLGGTIYGYPDDLFPGDVRIRVIWHADDYALAYLIARENTGVTTVVEL